MAKGANPDRNQLLPCSKLLYEQWLRESTLTENCNRPDPGRIGFCLSFGTRQLGRVKDMRTGQARVFTTAQAICRSAVRRGHSSLAVHTS